MEGTEITRFLADVHLGDRIGLTLRRCIFWGDQGAGGYIVELGSDSVSLSDYEPVLGQRVFGAIPYHYANVLNWEILRRGDISKMEVTTVELPPAEFM